MPSIGNDLASIRAHKGLSIEDIHKATRLPLDTLQSIEDGSIFMDNKEINTYIRSFVRTYGRALKLNEDQVTRALDQEELGNYNHLLLQDFPEIRKKKGLQENEESDEGESKERSGKVDEESDELTDPENDAEKTDSSKPKKNAKKSPTWTFEDEKGEKPTPPSEKKTTASSARSEPDMGNINWSGLSHDTKRKRAQPPVWIISAGLIVILIVTAAILITQFGFFTSDDVPPPESVGTEQPLPGAPESEEQDLALDLSDNQQEQPSAPAVLDDTLHVTVYAAFDRLDPVRVWSDLKPRIDPYWLDQGTAYNYEFQDTVRIRGSYSNMLLFLNGNRIDNFRGQYFNEEENAVELTRDLFDSDPRWATPVPFELPANAAEPDTVLTRPSFF